MTTDTETISLTDTTAVEEADAPCEFRFVNSNDGYPKPVGPLCDSSAEWAHLRKCCGAIRLFCDSHHQWHGTVTCLACGTRHVNRDASILRAWRI